MLYIKKQIMEKTFRIMENKVLKKEKIKSIEKAVDLLELLSDNKKEMGITEIGKELHMGVSTVYRILTTLKCRDYIVQNQQTSKYMLGAKLFILGCKVQNTTNLVKMVTPFLQRLSENTNETINFAILEGREAICLSKIESKEILKAGIEIGTKVPAHCTSLGKVLLAFLPEQEFRILYSNDNEKLSTFTPNSISSVEELKKCLKKIKKQGYAIDEEEFKIGVNCLGIPIINNEGKAIASISISGPVSRFNLFKMEKVKSTLIILSQDISKQLLNNM
jgi:DNA-binding IclR family transcriptional regulator